MCIYRSIHLYILWMNISLIPSEAKLLFFNINLFILFNYFMKELCTLASFILLSSLLLSQPIGVASNLLIFRNSSGNMTKSLLIAKYQGHCPEYDTPSHRCLRSIALLKTTQTFMYSSNVNRFIKNASWEICMEVRKQQLELEMEQQTGFK